MANTNYLTEDNGCTISAVTSENHKAPAANVLRPQLNKLWVTKEQEGLPQSVTIDVRGMKARPDTFNRVGFYLWHEYATNPALVEVSLRNSDLESWTTVAKIRLSCVSEWQYFKIKESAAKDIRLIRITIVETFGDNHTYLNQVALQSTRSEENAAVREKIMSEYTKLTGAERELKKAQEKISLLTSENLFMKDTIKQQNDVIAKMQESIKKLTKNVEKLHQMQTLHDERILHLEENGKYDQKKGKTVSSKERSKDNRKNAKVLHDYTVEDEAESRGEAASIRGNETVKSSQHPRSVQPRRDGSKSSFQKKGAFKGKKERPMEELSQYSDNDQSLQNRTVGEEGGESHKMLEKLQRLIALREKKRSELKERSGKRRRTGSEEESD